MTFSFTRNCDIQF